MKKQMKRLLSFALALILVVGIIPLSFVSATEILSEISLVELFSDMPSAGLTPLDVPITIRDDVHYVKTNYIIYSSWIDAETELGMSATDEFQPGKTYIGCVILEALEGHIFNYAVRGAINGEETTTVEFLEVNGMTFLSVTFEYTTDDGINNISIVDVSEPVNGELPCETATIETEGFSFATYEMGADTDLLWMVQNPYTNPDGRYMEEGETFTDFAIDIIDTPIYHVLMIVKAEGVILADDLTATVNGKEATLDHVSENYYMILCNMGTAVVPTTEVLYTSYTNNFVGGTLEVDIEAMAEADEEFMEAYFNDDVYIQWGMYDPETETYTEIEGANGVSYFVTEETINKSVRAVVTYAGKTAYGEYFAIPNIYGSVIGQISGVSLDDVVTVTISQYGEVVVSAELIKGISAMNYYFENIPVGEVDIEVSCEGYVNYIDTILVSPDGLSRLDIELKKPVNSIEMYIDAPVVGESLATDFAKIGEGYNATIYSWYENYRPIEEGQFTTDCIYAIGIYISAEHGYMINPTFTSVHLNDMVYVDGWEQDDGYVLVFEFGEAVEPTVVESIEFTVEAPKAGAEPSYALRSDGEGYIADIYSWFDSEGDEFWGTFEAGETYYVGILMRSTYGYILDPSQTIVTLNGMYCVNSWEEDGASVLIFQFEPAADYILGDINGDDELNATDYILAKRAVMGTYTLSETQILAGDINGDDTITATDYIFLKRAVMGTYVIA